MKNVIKKMNSLVLVFVIMCFISPLELHTSSVSDDGHKQFTQEELKAFEDEMALLINSAREENGLQPLYLVPHLCDYSHVRVRESVTKFSHYRPTQNDYLGIPSDETGENFDQYLRDENYPYLKAAENLAASEDPCSTEDAFNQWKGSTDGHWDAILDPDMTHMGVAVTYEYKDRQSDTYRNDPYEWYWELLMIEAQPDTAVVDDPDNPGMKKRVYFEKELEGQYIPTSSEIVPKSTGDLSGDGFVDSFDYIVILQYIQYQEALANQKEGKKYDEAILADPVRFNELQIEAADCFKDGVININDAKVLQKYVLGEIKTLPYEFN